MSVETITIHQTTADALEAITIHQTTADALEAIFNDDVPEEWVDDHFQVIISQVIDFIVQECGAELACATLRGIADEIEKGTVH